MKILLGKTAGVCFGVKRALDEANQALEENNKIYCLGELVHNKCITKKLQQEGMIFIDKIEDAKGKVIIRAHGEPEKTYKKAKELGLSIIDLTCPKVLKIHNIAKENIEKGYYIFLTGASNHPEVIGIIGFSKDNYSIIENIENVEEAVGIFKKSGLKKALLISQTTYSLEKFEVIEKELKKLINGNDLEVINTICLSTKQRQEETSKIAKEVQTMIIIGGKNSSNTTKLFDIANKYCKDVFFVETEKEIDAENFKKYETIGVMAGASTPMEIIEKVIEKLEELC